MKTRVREEMKHAHNSLETDIFTFLNRKLEQQPKKTEYEEAKEDIQLLAKSSSKYIHRFFATQVGYFMFIVLIKVAWVERHRSGLRIEAAAKQREETEGGEWKGTVLALGGAPL